MPTVDDSRSRLTEPPEQLGINLRASGLRASLVGRARRIFTRPVSAAVSMAIVTLATTLLLAVAPAQEVLIVASWLILCIGLMLLTRFGGPHSDLD